VVRAAASCFYVSGIWLPVDSSGLSLDGGRLRGAAKISLGQEFDCHPDRLKPSQRGQPNPPEMPVVGTLSVEIDVAFEGYRGTGTYQAAIGPADSKIRGAIRPGMAQGAVMARREAAPTPGKTVQCLLFAYFGGGDTIVYPEIVIRASLSDGASTEVVCTRDMSRTTQGHGASHEEFQTKGTLVLRDGALLGQVRLASAREKKEFEMTFQGQAIGRLLAGTVKTTAGDKAWTSTFVGLCRSAAWLPPLRWPRASWPVVHDATADAELVKEAVAESLDPVFCGEPGKRHFWTWRKLAEGQPVSCIHPPAFDLREAPGASRYRFQVQSGKVRLPVVSIAPPADCRPAPRVPVLELDGTKPLDQWLVLTPLETLFAKDPLAAVGGVAKCRPVPGMKVKVDERQCGRRNDQPGETPAWKRRAEPLGEDALPAHYAVQFSGTKCSYGALGAGRGGAE
jgi:hypothetical protein